MPREEVDLELAVRAAKEWGVSSAAVPGTFPLELADRLRATGTELTVDRDLFLQRRRVKTDAELAGIRRAQKGADEAMGAARDLLRRAEPKNGSVVLDGEPLTSERLKFEIKTMVRGRLLIAANRPTLRIYGCGRLSYVRLFSFSLSACRSIFLRRSSRRSRTLILRLQDCILAHSNNRHMVRSPIPWLLMASVVPHRQFA